MDKVWSSEDKAFQNRGTKDATVTIENGFLIVANKEGEKASLRMPKYLAPDGPVVELDPEYLKVVVPSATAASSA